jgi:flavin-dependent dehydrogenase
MMEEFDIAIIGAGMAGASLAAECAPMPACC